MRLTFSRPHPRLTERQRVVFVPLALTLLFWSSAFVAIRAALTSFDPGSLALMRYLIATLVLTLYWIASHAWNRGYRWLPARQDLLRFVLFGLLGVTTYNLGLNFGERTVTAGTASFIVGQIPIFTTLMAALILRERIRRRAALGIGIGFIGTVLLLFADRTGFRFNIGTVYVVTAVTSESLYFVLQKPVLARYRPIEMSVFTTWTGTLFMLPFAGGLPAELGAAHASALLPVIYLGIFPAAIAYLLWSYCLSQMTVFKTSTSLYSLPFLTIVIGLVWLGERPSALAVLGGVGALVGAIVVNTQRAGVPTASRPANSS